MRILFLEPPLDAEPTGIFPRHPPHYALYAAAVLREEGHEVHVLDAFVEDLSAADTARRAAALAPELLLLVPYDYTRETPPAVSTDLAERLRTLLPAARIGLVGSVDADHFQRQLEACPAIDFATVGEYERSLQAVAARESGALEGIPGLLLREEGGIVHTGPAELVEELDTLPWPAWDLVDFPRYTFVPHRYKHAPFYPLLASRGCPYGCLCCKEAKWSKITRFRLRSVPDVMAEILHARQRWGAREIQFSDATFGLRRGWVLELCEALQREAPGLPWTAITRVDRMDPELLGAMARAGCWNLLYGVESANQHALDIVGKRIDIPQVRRTIAATRAAGIRSTASFILGLPGEDRADVMRTIAFARDLDPDFAQFFVLKHFGDDDSLDAWGRVDPNWDLAPYDFRGPVFVPHGFSGPAELHALQRLAYRRFYLRPRMIARRLPELLEPGQVRRHLHAARILLGAALGR
jgi:anaerobic magnesium-protoporphyrin IX monomethyl ester cyclase